MTELQIQTESKPPRLYDAYRFFINTIYAEVPKIDVDLVLELLRLNYKYKQERSRVRLEIIYTENINTQEKKEEIYSRTKRVADVRDHHILIIDGYFRLQDIEELARDNQIQAIKGSAVSY